MNKKIILLIMIMVLSFTLITVSYADKALDLQPNIPLNKIWTVNFNKNVDKISVNKDTIYILDQVQNKILLEYKVLGTKVELIYKEGYKPNSKYTIYVTDKVMSNNTKLKDKK